MLRLDPAPPTTPPPATPHPYHCPSGKAQRGTLGERP